MKRLGQTDEISAVVAFFASEEARWVNGQTLRVNGVGSSFAFFPEECLPERSVPL